jgi:hypothetical protein
MGYSVIKSFERGIDTRKMIDTTEAGALLDARDCHITRGGEIEKRAAFIVTATLPASTKGFYATRGPVFHTWGIGAAPAGMPPRGVYHNVQLPNDPDTPVDESTLTIDSILSVEEWRNLLYVIVKYSDGVVRHWYNDALVMTVPIPAAALGSLNAPLPAPTLPLPQLPAPLVTPAPQAPTVLSTPIPLPGPTPPTMPAAGRPQCSFYLLVNPIGATLALKHISMASPSAAIPQTVAMWNEPGGDYKRLMDNMADWVDLGIIGGITFTYAYWTGYTLSEQGAGAEQQLASLINAHVPAAGDPKAWCIVAADGRLTVWIEEQTPKWNGWGLSFQGDGFVFTLSGPATDPTLVFIQPVFSGGVEAPPPPPVTEDPGTPFVAKPENKGTFVLAHNEKLYCTQQQYLNFTKLRTPAYAPTTGDFISGWWPTEGSGYIDHSMMGEGTPNLISLADYGGDLAVFGERHIFIWRMDPDPLQNFKKQALHRAGTIAPHSVVSFGQNEVMYLDRSGIRSLRQREAQDAGFASDLGNNIDDLVTAKIRNSTVTEQQRNFWGEVEPNSGRLWMALHDVIFVLSYYPGNRIAGWTWYDASAYPIDMLNATDEHIYWRSGNNVLVYGGETGVDYDMTEAMIRVPYIDAGKPATFKSWSALDAAVLGTWQIKGSFDPTQPTAFDLLANITKSTYAQGKIAVNGKSPSLSLELRTTFNGPARIGNATLHYEQDFAD